MNESAQPISRTPSRAWALSNFLAGGGAYLPGIVLMVAGVLKLHEYLTVSPFAPSTGFIPHRFLFAIAVVELVLALHLILQYANPTSWVVAVGLFTASTVLNLVMIVRGQPTCECFGRLPTSPWVALGFDMLCLGSLIRYGPSIRVMHAQWRARSSQIRLRGFIKFVVLVACGSLFLSARTRDSILDYLDPARTIVACASPDTFDTEPGKCSDLTVTLVNRTCKPVTFLGKHGRCGVQLETSFPITVPPRGEISILGSVSINKPEGNYTVPAVLITDSSSVPLGCSPKTDPVVMRVSAARKGKETRDEQEWKKAAYAGAGGE